MNKSLKQRNLKVFGLSTGMHRGIVAATSQKEAADLFDVSLGYMREHGCETGNAEECSIALKEPGIVWKCSNSYHNGTWTRK